MHPCLRLDEIIRLLARELVESQAKTTAVALACCCKTFEEPVLDVLWETQARLTPLLKCLPQDTWEGSTKFVSLLIAFTLHLVNHKIRKSFKRTSTKAEWADFRKYALRMRQWASLPTTSRSWTFFWYSTPTPRKIHGYRGSKHSFAGIPQKSSFPSSPSFSPRKLRRSPSDSVEVFLPQGQWHR